MERKTIHPRCQTARHQQQSSSTSTSSSSSSSKSGSSSCNGLWKNDEISLFRVKKQKHRRGKKIKLIVHPKSLSFAAALLPFSFSFVPPPPVARPLTGHPGSSSGPSKGVPSRCLKNYWSISRLSSRRLSSRRLSSSSRFSSSRCISSSISSSRTGRANLFGTTLSLLLA
ncbi:hypothetical protein ACSSS7_000750 [Eimeria intestinalis]